MKFFFSSFWGSEAPLCSIQKYLQLFTYAHILSTSRSLYIVGWVFTFILFYLWDSAFE